MPEFMRGRLRDTLTFVALNARFYYGWASPDLTALAGISAPDLVSQLGHVSAETAQAVANSIMVTGANSPKPMRVRKVIPNATQSNAASVSSFVAFDKLAAANAGGWKRAQPGRGVRLTPNEDVFRTVSAIAELSNGLLYVFPLNRLDFNRVFGELGLQAASQITALESVRLATGANTRPGKAAARINEGTFSTYYSTAAKAAAASAGYTIVSDELIEYGAGVAPTPP